MERLGKPFVFFTGCYSAEFEDLDYVSGMPGDILIVVKKQPCIQHFLKVLRDNDLVNIRILNIADNLDNWFVSFETVYPNTFKAIYDLEGYALLKR
jgi:hypothetical protein